MIIRFPTALYETVIPENPDDSGNITFTVSSTDPPRSVLSFQQLPVGIERRQRITNAREVRTSLGDLAFTITKGSREHVGNNKKQFEIGQILEFGDNLDPTADRMLVNDEIQVRHDTNLFNLDDLGLSDIEQDSLTSKSQDVIRMITMNLNDARRRRRNAEIDINDVQKTLNEARKTLDAALIIEKFDPDAVSGTIDKLQVKITELEEERESLILVANQAAADATVAADELREVAQLVR